MSRAGFPGTGLKRSERFNHKEMVKASLLSCILPRAHYTAWHILFEECVVRSSLIRISVKFFHMSFDKMLVSVRSQPIIAFIVSLNKKM